MSGSPGQQPRAGGIPKQLSSLNVPSRLGTPEVTNTATHDRRVAQLPISKNLNAFEQLLNSLLVSISKYSPSTTDAQKLVDINRQLTSSLEDIIAHQRSGLDIDSLEAQSAKVDSNCKQILLGLSECRKKLNALPSLEKTLEEESRMKKTQIKADELLAYAMKLAKFTRAPPTFDSAAIGPSNFVWPAEDMLRRGTLAIAAIEKEKMLGEVPVEGKEDEGNLFEAGELEAHQQVQQTERRGSFGGNYGGDVQVTADDDDLDLDLFDPDEE